MLSYGVYFSIGKAQWPPVLRNSYYFTGKMTDSYYPPFTETLMGIKILIQNYTLSQDWY